MKNRFGENESFFKRKSRYLFIFIYAIIIILAVYFFNKIGNKNISYEKDSLKSALQRDIATCYAIEGFYPPSLEYIEENYGLVYDEDIFYIDYSAYSSNMYPDVTIIDLRGKSQITIR